MARIWNSTLNRSAGLKRSPWRKSAPPDAGIPVIPLRRSRDPGPDAKMRLTVLERDGYACVRCGADITDRAYSIHHRKRRSQSGRNELQNLLTLCGTGTTGCHGWVHAHPADARDAGWLVRGSDKPAEVSVLIVSATLRLDRYGGYTTEPPRHPEAAAATIQALKAGAP